LFEPYSAPKVRNFLLFVKRKAPSLHYSNERKESRNSVTTVHSLDPDMEGLGIRGEAWALQIAGTGRGSGSGDLRVFIPAEYRLISLPVSLKQRGPTASHFNLI
jgi:hypothetical protein